ncbi:hypothetical protein JKP88DRAFT_231284 [Tribonema minus]|uniref:Uncharacterized protein n=1 Tax=Tribonema minus TaxID=303371 RepID=A0A835ZE85_9STRA|nr:hypothetical protein JKP88DRAFT_231284 [Tribonema minus]
MAWRVRYAAHCWLPSWLGRCRSCRSQLQRHTLRSSPTRGILSAQAAASKQRKCASEARAARFGRAPAVHGPAPCIHLARGRAAAAAAAYPRQPAF